MVQRLMHYQVVGYLILVNELILGLVYQLLAVLSLCVISKGIYRLIICLIKVLGHIKCWYLNMLILMKIVKYRCSDEVYSGLAYSFAIG